MGDNFRLKSWMDLTGKKGIKARGSSARHVARIFFATKEYTVPKDGEKVIQDLAVVYTYTAKTKKGLKGTIIGYADSQPSTSPDNQELSAKRAYWTFRKLSKLLASSSRVIVGNFDFDRDGRGDEAAQSDTKAQQGDANALAEYRRADIFISTSLQFERPPVPVIPPPDLSGVVKESRLTEWLDFYLKGNKKMINGLAIHAIGYVDGTDELTILYSFGCRSVKPPWWDKRETTDKSLKSLYPRIRANGADEALARKAILLLRDYWELVYWAEKIFDPGGSLAVWHKTKTAESYQTFILQGCYYIFIANKVRQLAAEIYRSTK